MERSEAYWILHNMWSDATEEQREALSIAQRDIEFVDLMDDRFVPVRRGRWVMKENMIRSIYAKNAYCSECLEETSYAHNYCPNCGATMDKENDNDL